MKETKYTVKYTTSFKKDYKRAMLNILGDKSTPEE